MSRESGDSPVRVLYSYPNRIGVTGIGNIAWQNVQGLIQEGTEIRVFCGSCERPFEGCCRIVETLRPLGARVPYRLLGGADRARALHDYRVARAIASGRIDIDIVHCWPLGSLRTLKAARARGIRTVLERPNAHTRFAYEVVRDETERLGLKLSPDNPHYFNAARLVREEREYELADYLLCPSEFVARTFLEQGFKEERLLYHRYGFDPAKFSLPERSDSRDKNLPLSVVFVGRCEPRKGLHIALEAWLASPASESGHFFICGHFVSGYRERLASMLAHRSVRVVGFTDDVPAIMRKCHALVLSSVEEGSSLVTYEARACGCILLVSAATGARCVDGVDGLVHKVGDVRALCEHFTILDRDRTLLRRLRAASLAGTGDLTWRAAARELLAAYHRSLAIDSRKETD